MKPQFPTVQEQINYWNTKERLEHERVMDIRAESPNERTETGDDLLSVCKQLAAFQFTTYQYEVALQILVNLKRKARLAIKGGQS